MKFVKTLIWNLYFTILAVNVHGQQTVGLFKTSNEVSEGYVLVAPLFYTKAYLINNCGESVHEWNFDTSSGPLYLLEDGRLLRTGWDTDTQFKAGGVTGYLELLDWESNIIWSYKISNAQESLHHDVFMMQNGNILATVWERKTKEDVLNAGRNPDLFSEEIFSEKVIELKPIDENTYEIVWQWSTWDHLIQEYDPELINYGNVTEHPELLNINYTSDLAEGRDWIHFNSIDYNPELNLILLSARHFNEIWIIDHSTTTEEAAGHSGGDYKKGGDLLYRWGNPRAYNHADNQQLFGQHDVRWIMGSSLLEIKLFNNGFNRSPNHSYIETITPVLNEENEFLTGTDGTYLPPNSEQLYTQTDENFYSSITSGSQLLKEGKNLLVTLGASGHCYEVELETGEVLWEYVSPVTGQGPQPQGSNVVSPDPTKSNTLFKVWKYDADLLGDYSDQLAPDPKPVELNPLASPCLVASVRKPSENPVSVYPSITRDIINIDSGYPEVNLDYMIYSMQGHLVAGGILNSAHTNINFRSQPSGIYFVVIQYLGGDEKYVFRVKKN